MEGGPPVLLPASISWHRQTLGPGNSSGRAFVGARSESAEQRAEESVVIQPSGRRLRISATDREPRTGRTEGNGDRTCRRIPRTSRTAKKIASQRLQFLSECRATTSRPRSSSSGRTRITGRPPVSNHSRRAGSAEEVAFRVLKFTPAPYPPGGCLPTPPGGGAVYNPYDREGKWERERFW